MNKFKEFVKWVYWAPENRQLDAPTRILCAILVTATILLGVFATIVAAVSLCMLMVEYPIVIFVLLFVVLPSYLWVKFYKGESK